MIWLVLFPMRIMLAVCFYTIGLLFLLTIIGIPIGLTCFGIARELLTPR